MNSKSCGLLLASVGIVAAFAAYTIPEMRVWFSVWAAGLFAIAAVIFVHWRGAP